MIGRALGVAARHRVMPLAPMGGVFTFFACIAAAFALGAAPALASAPCANEQVRGESDLSPVTGEPYSRELPDCRAFEMVSPLDKQSEGAEQLVGSAYQEYGLAASPEGEASGWESGGQFAGEENFYGGLVFHNGYVSRRGPSGWSTSGTFAPAALIGFPAFIGLNSFFTSDLRSGQASCGEAQTVVETGGVRSAFVCAARALRQGTLEYTPWQVASFAPPRAVSLQAENRYYVGASADLSRLFVQPGSSLRAADVADLEQRFIDTRLEQAGEGYGAVLYEVMPSGSLLRAVNVDNSGRLLVNGVEKSETQPEPEGPLTGDALHPGYNGLGETGIEGTSYHAISQSGQTVFFSATPPGAVVPLVALYARIHCVPAEGGPWCREDGNGEYLETIAVSDPSQAECPSCVRPVSVANATLNEGSTVATVPSGGFPNVSAGMEVSGPGIPGGTFVSSVSKNTLTLSNAASAGASGVELGFAMAKGATFQGASADGSKVFFTTTQSLLPGDKNKTATDLYEYRFITRQEELDGKSRLTLISSGAEGEQVTGVVRVSSDGSHVYFVARGEVARGLPEEEENANGEKWGPGEENVYGYDTSSGSLKFVVAGFNASHEGIKKMEVFGAAGVHEEEVSLDAHRAAQTTPDGRYLAFSMRVVARAGDTNPASVSAAYLFDFETGTLTWISKPAPGCTGCGGEGREALIPATPTSMGGAQPEIEDFDRAISGESEAEAPGRTPRERHDGEYVLFVTSEKLQSGDENKSSSNVYAGIDLYEWHCPSGCPHPSQEGVVSMISAGQGIREGKAIPKDNQVGETTSGESVAMSASGSDIFFINEGAQLVKQDADAITDVYDARVDGGFPAPPPAPACADESCQPQEPPMQQFALATSSVFAAAGNLAPPATGTLAFTTTTPRPKALTRKQRLAKALKACQRKHSKRRRAACKARARRKYGAKKHRHGAKKHRRRAKKAHHATRRTGARNSVRRGG
jgi:hypothetical protein